MKIAFIGCVEFSYLALRRVMEMPDVELVGVITRQQSSFNADFHSLEELAHEAGTPCYLAQGNDQQEMSEWLRKLNPDVIYCFGWSYLLSNEVLNIPPSGVVGFHPAALPKNRGRHPIIWALALGLSKTASTFFIMDEGADSGDIISQESITIDPDDDAGTLYSKIIDTALLQIEQFSINLSHGRCSKIKQDDSQATYWRKRSKQDGLIDWRMSARNIFNLVRALTHPYVGAHCLYSGAECKVWCCEQRSLGADYTNIEPGRVLSVDGCNIVVKCGDDAIVLTKHELDPLPEEGDYL